MDASAGEKWDRGFFILLSAIFLWRVLYIAITPLELAPDEAYYWDWSRSIDWGYFSKPPLIAWINALSTRMLGSSAFALRLPAACLSVAGIWALHDFARRLFDSRAAFWSAAALVASPGHAAIGIIMTIDAPLLFFWILSLNLLWRAIDQRKKHLGRLWIFAGVILGLGMLSKQMMMTFPLLALLFLLSSTKDRPLLKKPWPYGMVIISFLFLLPVVWWNMRHSWVTLNHTFHHFAGARGGLSTSLINFGNFLGSQLLILSPLTWFLLAAVSVMLATMAGSMDRRLRYLFIFSALPLSVSVILSLRQGINANWPAAFYPAGMVMVAVCALTPSTCGVKMTWVRKLFLPAIFLGAICSVFIYALPWIVEISGLGGGARDPLIRMKGWRQLGDEIERSMKLLPERSETFILTESRQLTSEIAFYSPERPRVFLWPGEKGAIRNQYDILPGPKPGRDGLIVLEGNREVPPDIVLAFDSVELFRKFDVRLGQAGVRRYSLFVGRFLRNWPQERSTHAESGEPE